MKKQLLSVLILLCSFSLIAQEWEQVASLPSAFDDSHHSFGFGIDGLGYLVTGSNSTGGVRNDFYQYDPALDEWTALEDFPGPARSFAIGDTWDGKAYLGFGVDENDDLLRDLWVFDPTDMSWTELEACPCIGRNHPALIAHNGKVFMGMGNANTNLNDWWEYDIATNSWSEKPDFPGLPRHHPYQFAIGDYIYTGFGHGGNFISKRWYRYDPATEDWEEMSSLPAEGRVAGTQFSYNGKGYALSGDGDDHQTMDTGEFWSYDPETDEWTEMPPHPSVSRWAPSSFVIDGEVYLMNGMSLLGANYQFVSTVYKFQIEQTPSNVEELSDISFSVYPNPFSDDVQLEWGSQFDTKDAKIRVYNIYGQVVFETEELSNSLDLSKLQNGWLRVELTNEEESLSQTILKQ